MNTRPRSKFELTTDTPYPSRIIMRLIMWGPVVTPANVFKILKIKFNAPCNCPVGSTDGLSFASMIKFLAIAFLNTISCYLGPYNDWTHPHYLCVVNQCVFFRWRHRVFHENPLKWRHNELDGVSDHQPDDCLLNRLFRCKSKKKSNLRVTGLCAGNSPVTGEFPAQRASNAENVSILWRHHVFQP